MKGKRRWLKQIAQLGFLSLMGASMSAFGFLGFGDSVTWKEEVLLHDGQKIIATRSQSYGGAREIGQLPSIKEQDITFTVPGSSQTLTWKNEYGKEVGGANFILRALHVLKGAPYIVAIPNSCRAYDKWGRPNPPYVIFRHDGKDWQRIPFSELPIEFKETNLSWVTKAKDEQLTTQSLVTAELVKKLNSRLETPANKTILREPLKRGADGGVVNCEEMIPAEDGGGVGITLFAMKPTYEACLKACAIWKISQQNCPCNRLFGKK